MLLSILKLYEEIKHYILIIDFHNEQKVLHKKVLHIQKKFGNINIGNIRLLDILHEGNFTLDGM